MLQNEQQATGFVTEPLQQTTRRAVYSKNSVHMSLPRARNHHMGRASGSRRDRQQQRGEIWSREGIVQIVQPEYVDIRQQRHLPTERGPSTATSL